MIFSSLEFLCVFFPAAFLVHCALPSTALRNAWLVGVSLLFYAYGEPVYVLLMVFSAGMNYIAARGIAVSGHKKYIVWADIAANLGILVFFKYTWFLVGSINQGFGTQFKALGVTLPIGISFFTFQAISYVVDVYRGKIQAQENFWKLLLYISFFPQLIAGSIVKYRDVNAYLDKRKVSVPQAASGLRRFICGLGKKVLIANAMGQAADAIFSAGAPYINILSAWVGAIAYMLQIYYDFSGYSDMAIGLGAMFGFQFQENFQYPYGAPGIQEFWHRWHISLSVWFKEYLYIPLGGNRKGSIRTGINKFAVFFCTGLWHGADWTVVVWGLYHRFFSLLEDMLPFLTKMPKIALRLYTLFIVCIGFVIFRADSLGQGIFFVQQMFAGYSFDALKMGFAMQQLTPWFLAMAAAGLALMAPIKPIAVKVKKAVSEGMEAHLADGMEIVVTRRLLVKLTVDGREEEFLTEADTVEGLLKEQGIRLDKMDKITPLPGERPADGAEVVVQRVSVKEVAQREPIPYGTRTEYSDSLFEGETVQKQQGKPGEKEVVYQVTYVDGEEESRTPISERTIQEPVSAVIVKGVKKRRRVISKEARKGYGGFSVCGQEAVNRSDREKLWEPLQNFSGRGYGVCLKVQEKFGL